MIDSILLCSVSDSSTLVCLCRLFCVLMYVVIFFLAFGCQYQCSWFCLERLVSEMTCYVSSGMLNPTHSHTSSAILSLQLYVVLSIRCFTSSTNILLGLPWYHLYHLLSFQHSHCKLSSSSTYHMRNIPLPHQCKVHAVSGSCRIGLMHFMAW